MEELNMKKLNNYDYITLFILGVILIIGCSRTEDLIGLEEKSNIDAFRFEVAGAPIFLKSSNDFVEIFSDDFDTNTTNFYTWIESGSGDKDPTNNYVHDPVNKWVTITTADNVNIFMSRVLPTTTTSGYFEISFMPWQTWPLDGLVQIKIYGQDGGMYLFHFAHISSPPDPGNNNQYRAHLQKQVNGELVINEIFVPSPDRYNLGEWHTFAMRFSPITFTGYLDGVEIISRDDLSSNIIDINSFEIAFMQQDQHLDNIKFLGLPPIVQAIIDIKPGSYPNSINPNSKGVIPVAILTTEDFDATNIDPQSVEFGPNGATETHGIGHIEDSDNDGDNDLVLHFRTQETGISEGDTEACLTGQTYNGETIQGCDAIKTVEKK